MMKTKEEIQAQIDTIIKTKAVLQFTLDASKDLKGVVGLLIRDDTRNISILEDKLLSAISIEDIKTEAYQNGYTKCYAEQDELIVRVAKEAFDAARLGITSTPAGDFEFNVEIGKEEDSWDRFKFESSEDYIKWYINKQK